MYSEGDYENLQIPVTFAMRFEKDILQWITGGLGMRKSRKSLDCHGDLDEINL